MKTGLFSRSSGKLSDLQHVAELTDSVFQSALDTLVHANLIRVVSAHNHYGSWSTHKLLRDYAEEVRLNKDPRKSAIERRYVEYYVKIALGFEDEFNQGVMQTNSYTDSVPEICHAIEIAQNHNWSSEFTALVRASVSPLISMGQFHALKFIERIGKKKISNHAISKEPLSKIR